MANRADIDTGIFVVNELREIFVLLKKFLRSLEGQIDTYPSHTIVGSSIRGFAVRFVNAWRRPFEKTLSMLESITKIEIVQRRSPSSDTESDEEIVENLCEADIAIRNDISLIISLINRLDKVLEIMQLISSDSASDCDSVKDALGTFGLWLSVVMKPFPKVIYPTVLEQFSESARGLNELRPRGY